MEEKIIGIDLGTSNSAAAVMIGGKPTIIPAAEGVSIGGKAVPSVVAFTKDNQILVGEPARRQAALNPKSTVLAIKRKMGSDYKVNINGKEYTPQEISSFILKKIKKDAEAFLGQKVEKAVITVPAYFNDAQRQATKDAGEIAGLNVVRLINEPTAASFAYGLDKQNENLKILVYDFGGGTLDVTIMDFGDGVFQVLSTAGDTQLGGTDMDNALIDYIVGEFKKDQGIDLKNDPMAMQRVREAAEKAKVELSTMLETSVNLPFISADTNGPKHLVMTLTRAKLETLVNGIIEKSSKSIEKAITDAGIQVKDINKIILVGGPTRMPAVQNFIKNYFGKEPERGVDPMECVAMGAAIQGAVLTGEVKDVVLVDVTPLTLGIETMGGVFTEMIKRNTPVPTSKSQIFTTAADNQSGVEVHVLQGERPLVKDDISLGKFILDGLAPAPRGVPQIEVTYDIDSNGIVHVTAKDKATGKEQHITIQNANKLSKEEIEKMKRESEMHSSEDEEMRSLIEEKNKADQLIFSSEKFINDNKDKISPEDISSMDAAISSLKDALKDNDKNEITRNFDNLNAVISSVGSKMYNKNDERAEGNGNQGNNEGTVYNGEVVQ